MKNVEDIIYTSNSEERFEMVRSIDNSTDLYRLMELYNWDDGFGIPCIVVTHEKCDLGLALMLFWEIDEPKLYYENPESEWLFSKYVDPKEIDFKIQFCKTLIEGIRAGRYKKGSNVYDTGFFGEHLHPTDERKTRIRQIKTKKALSEFEKVFLMPCLNEE